MPTLMKVMILLVVSLLFTSCSNDHKAMLVGVWEAEQFEQKIGSDDQLIHYNHLEINETGISGKYFYWASVEGGSLQKKYNPEEKTMNYHWKTEKEILIEDTLYEVKVKKNELFIKNENINMRYIKSD